MNKSTKSLWIYAAVLFLAAIGLIFLTTITQARLVKNNGDFEVLGTLNENARQNVVRLTQENVALQNKINRLEDENKQLSAELESLKTAQDADQTIKQVVAQAYDAYAKKDYETLEALMENITKEQLDTYLPGFYAETQKAISASNNLSKKNRQ